MAQKTFAQQQFCTISDVRDTIEQMEVISSRSLGSDDFNGYAQRKIDIAKNRILKFDLLKEADKRFPQTVKQWMSFMRQQIDDRRNDQARAVDQSGARLVMPFDERSGTSGDAYLGFYGAINGFDAGSVTTEPNVYCYKGIPTNGTLANTAKTGAILIDTNQIDNQFAYRNIGTLAAPVWRRTANEDSLDLIYNPDVLVNCACYATLMLMAADGVITEREGRGDRFSFTVETMMSAKYDEAKYGRLSDDGKKRISAGDFSLVRWDIDGDGVISDYEVEAARPVGRRVAIW
ncbi:MAG: hypothetical protein JSS75_07195 [Bacteroidetes bacterium]|nr:hypothetical protein [Bacteroidota bacterium]